MNDNAMQQKDPESEFDRTLKAYRKEIDTIDEELVALICKRSNIVASVGKLKKAQGINISPMRPAREASQLKKMVERFQSEVFPETAATYIWRHIINGSLSIEGVYSVGVCSPMMGTSELVWLAREYFGAYSQITRENQPIVLVSKVRQDQCHIAVLPYPENEDKNPWWLDLMNEDASAPTIFLKLPYLTQAASKSPGQQSLQAFAIAKVAEEDFGEEGLSAIAMRTETNCSMGKLQETFRQAGLDATWLSVANISEMERAHFIEVKGHVSNQSEALSKIRDLLQQSLVNIRVIGRYAAAIQA